MRRRPLFGLAALAPLGLAAIACAGARAQAAPASRPIPSSGELLPAVGLGTWITFNVGRDAKARAQCVQVMREFFSLGGRLVDSSPMYGSSQGVVGEGLAQLGAQQRVFSAEKVWTSGDGATQLEETRAEWKLPRFDLLQVHNLVAWEKQLALLQQMKARGQLRYIGITTSEGRRHADIERIMAAHRIDFVQLTYNLVDRRAEERLLPLARERGIAVIANRPFDEGALIRKLKRHPLPPWARDADCEDWAQFALKFVLAHPAVTCTIPATSQPAHLRENMGAARGRLPDDAMRKRMVAHVASL